MLKALSLLVVAFAVIRDLPHVKERAIDQISDRAPQTWNAMKQVQAYLRKQMGQK
jgi:hypothetical protein